MAQEQMAKMTPEQMRAIQAQMANMDPAAMQVGAYQPALDQIIHPRRGVFPCKHHHYHHAELRHS